MQIRRTIVSSYHYFVSLWAKRYSFIHPTVGNNGYENLVICSDEIGVEVKYPSERHRVSAKNQCRVNAIEEGEGLDEDYQR
jgi:hypothetical protein